jgi:autoinducer 2-degrading protein
LSTPLLLLTRLRIRPGRVDEAIAVISSNVAASVAEEGVWRMALHRDTGPDDDWLTIVECFADEAALDRHRQEPHVAAVVAALPDLLAGPVESITLDPIPTGGSPKDRIV